MADFRGQQLAYKLMLIFVYGFWILGLGLGWWYDSRWLWFCTTVAGLVVALVMAVPEWPWLNRHPLVLETPPSPAASSPSLPQSQQPRPSKAPKKSK